tara:strand:+ start:281 stop:691 length:411 start_codon:yes stop_codon:yes gene_type:complete
MAGLTESWMSDKSKDGVRMAGQGDEFAVGTLPQAEDDYMILYDTLDGHPLRIPLADRTYMLAKARAVVPGERADWVRVAGTKGVIQHAPGGTTPSYSETPVALQANRTKPLAMAQGVRAVRSKRKRGKRGKRKVLS